MTWRQCSEQKQKKQGEQQNANRERREREREKKQSIRLDRLPTEPVTFCNVHNLYLCRLVLSFTHDAQRTHCKPPFFFWLGVASGAVGGDAVLALDVRDGKLLPEFVATDGSTPLHVSHFAASPHRLFLTTASGGLHALDLRWPRSEIQWLAHSAAISALCIAERDERVFTGARDGVCRVFDAAQIARSRPRSDSTLINTNRCRAQFVGHTGEIVDLLFANDLLYSASADKTLRVWSDKAGSANPCLLLISINRDLASFRLAVSHKQIFLFAPNAKSVLVLDETTGRVLHKLQGHTSGVHHVVSDGFAYMITCSADGTMRKWSVRSGACLSELTGHTAAVTHALVYNKFIYSGSADGSVREWANLDLSQREATLIAANMLTMPSLNEASARHAPVAAAAAAAAAAAGAAGLGDARRSSNDHQQQHQQQLLALQAMRGRNCTVLRSTLERLDLSQRNLHKILLVPKDAAHMDLLELRADSNVLTAVPKNVLKTNVRLRLLSLNSNMLKALDVPRLPALTHLLVAHNRIKALPADFGRLLPSLRVLELHHNDALKSLPESLLACTALERLCAAHCALTRLPAQLENLFELRELDVAHNRIFKLPTRIGDLRKLRSVAVGHNQLTDLPGSLLRLFGNGSLQTLDLAGNPFAFSLGQPTSLEALETELRRSFNPARDMIGNFNRPLPQQPPKGVAAPRAAAPPAAAPAPGARVPPALPQRQSQPQIVAAPMVAAPPPRLSGAYDVEPRRNPRAPQRAIAASDDDEGPDNTVTMIDANGVAVEPASPRVPSMRDSAAVATPAVPLAKPNSKRRRANADAQSTTIETDAPATPLSLSASSSAPVELPPLPVDSRPRLDTFANLPPLPQIGAAAPAPSAAAPVVEESDYGTIDEDVLRDAADAVAAPVETVTVLPRKETPPAAGANTPQRFVVQRSRADTRSDSGSFRPNMRPSDSAYDIVSIMRVPRKSSIDIDNVTTLGEDEEWAPDRGDDNDDEDEDRVEYEDIVIAQHDYMALQPYELSFAAGDQIHVLERDKSGWWRGMVLGRADLQVGLFPMTLVQELVVLDVDSDSMRLLDSAIASGTQELAALKAQAEAEAKAKADAEAKARAEAEAKAKADAERAKAAKATAAVAAARPVATEGAIARESQKLTLKAGDYGAFEVVVAAHTYEAKKPKELSFLKGDQLVVEKKLQEKGWWHGFVLGAPNRRGFFPSTFVKKPAPAAAPPVTQRPRAPTLEHIEGGEAMMAIHDYDAEEANELSLRRYDIVDVVKKNHKTRWFKARLRGTNQVGWVPSILLEKFVAT